jgi:hypothetical protein
LPALKAELSQVVINSKVESFNSVMTDILDCYAHLKMVTYYESSIASGDVELYLLIERRELAYSLWRSMPSRRRGDGNWREFRRISDQVVWIDVQWVE